MHTALRPFMTTGVAIVGAGVLAVAPVMVAPPMPPVVEVAAPAAAIRTVTADLELTALIDALIVAIPEAAVGTAQFLFQTWPNAILADIASGQFAHAVAIAIVVPAIAYSLPLAPIVEAFASELPLPLGTFDGILKQGLFLANSLPSIPVDLILLAAQVLDGSLAPADFPAAAATAVTNRLTTAVESFQKIIAAIGGALPLSVLSVSPQELQPFTIESDLPAESTVTEAFSADVGDATQDSPVKTVTLTVDAAAATDDADEVDRAPIVSVASVAEVEEQRATAADDDESSNGATDLSDGNQAVPGELSDEPVGGVDTDATAGAEDGADTGDAAPAEGAGDPGAGDASDADDAEGSDG